MCMNVSDAAIGARLATMLFGVSGFCCHLCGHTQAWHIKPPSLKRKCKRCRHTQSLLSGTILQHTKLPLRVWMLRLEYYEDGAIPTSTEFAEVAEISRSAAWELNQKIFRAGGFLTRELGDDPDSGQVHVRLKCRGPRGPALGPTASEWLRHLHDDVFRKQRDRFVTVRLNTLGDQVSADAPALTPTEQLRPPRPDGTQHLLHRGLDIWLVARLEETHGTVSLRWLERWVAHLCLIWSSHDGRRTPIPRGLELLAYTARCPMRELVPYG